MSRPARARRLALVGLLFAVMSFASTGIGVAALRATAGSGSGVVASGTFGAAPRTASHQNNSPLLLAWGAGGPDTQYFDVRNTGSLELTGATYTVLTSNGGRGAPSLALTACLGGRWSATGMCSGTEQSLGSWRLNGAVTVTGPAPTVPNEDLHLRASVIGRNLRGGEQITAQISVTVSSGADRQLRTARVLSS